MEPMPPPTPPFLSRDPEGRGTGEPEPGPPAPDQNEAPPQDPTMREFQEKFGIREEELEGLEGFKELSEGRKLLVLENLKQITHGRIREEAESKYREHTSRAGFLGRMWQGISKRYQVAKLEKATAQDFEQGGITTHGEILKQLALGAQMGPEAVKTTDGKVEINYLSTKSLEIRLGRTLTEEEQEGVKGTNLAFTEFSKIPNEWSLDSASRYQKEQFRNARDRFEETRADLTQFLMSNGETRADAFIYTNKIDSQIQLNQFLASHPDVEEALQRIRSKPAWAAVFKEVATERGLYFAGGFALRSATISMLGFIGAPLAAAGIGAFSAYQRGKGTLQFEEKTARHGMTRKERRGAKLTEKKEIVKRRHFTDADTLNKRLERLTNRLWSAEPSELELKHLARLVTLTQEKLAEGLVNFGTVEKRTKTQYDLMQNLIQAQVFLVEHSHNTRIADSRVEQLLELRKEKISGERKKYLVKQVLQGAGLAAGFAAAGAVAREFINMIPGDEATAAEGPKTDVPEAPGGATTEFPEEPIERYRIYLKGELYKETGRTPTSEEIEAVLEGQKGGEITQEEMAKIMDRMKTGPLSRQEIQELYLARPEIETPEVIDKEPGVEKAPEKEAAPSETGEKYPGRGELHAEAVPGGGEITGIEAAKPGDSIWKMSERQLAARFGERFSELDITQRDYIIDAIKDKVAQNPEAFGLRNIDELRIGQEVDFSTIFEKEQEIKTIFESAANLDAAEMANIGRGRQVLLEWAREHPGERLTSEKVEEILRSYGVESAQAPAETPPGVEPLTLPETVQAPEDIVPPKENPPPLPADGKEAAPYEAGEEYTGRGTPPAEKTMPGEYAEITREAQPLSHDETLGATLAPEPESAPPEYAFGSPYEKEVATSLGFTPKEYSTIRNVTVGKLLSEMPETKNEMWDRLGVGVKMPNRIDLPPGSNNWMAEWENRFFLAHYLRKLLPDESEKQLTIREFLSLKG